MCQDIEKTWHSYFAKVYNYKNTHNKKHDDIISYCLHIFYARTSSKVYYEYKIRVIIIENMRYDWWAF
jgi:hypothetical protein